MPRAFHNPDGDPRPHYDLKPEFRELALLQGALPLTRQEFVEFLRLGRSSLLA